MDTRLPSLLVLLCSFPLVLRAQQTGSITGRVVDSAGQPLVRATVRALGTTRGAYTRADGTFRIDHIAVGTWTLRVASVGMAPVDIPVVVVDTLPTLVATPIVLQPRPPAPDRDRWRPRPSQSTGTVRSFTNEGLQRTARPPE